MTLYLNLDGMSKKEAFKAIDEFIPRVAKHAALKQRSVEMSENTTTPPTDLDDATVRRLIRQEHPEMRMFPARKEGDSKS